MYKYFRDHFVPLYYTTRIRPLGDNYKLWPHRSHLARDIIGRHPQERALDAVASRAGNKGSRKFHNLE